MANPYNYEKEGLYMEVNFVTGAIALFYAVCMVIITFSLSEVAHKALKEESRQTPLAIFALALMIAIFFGGFGFAKFLFGF